METDINNWIKANSSFTQPTNEETGKTVTTRYLSYEECVCNAFSTNRSLSAFNPSSFWQIPSNFPHKVTTILNLAQKSSGFDPSNPYSSENNFNAYASSLSNFPGARLYTNDLQNVHYSSSDINQSISSIVYLFDGLTSPQLNDVTNSISQMARNVFSQYNSSQSITKFSQQVLDDSIRYPFGYSYSFFTRMNISKSTSDIGGKHQNTSVSQDLSVRRLIVQFDDNVFIRYSRVLDQMTNTALQDWINNNTSRSIRGRDLDLACCFSGSTVQIQPKPPLVPVSLLKWRFYFVSSLYLNRYLILLFFVYNFNRFLHI